MIFALLLVTGHVWSAPNLHQQAEAEMAPGPRSAVSDRIESGALILSEKAPVVVHRSYDISASVAFELITARGDLKPTSGVSIPLNGLRSSPLMDFGLGVEKTFSPRPSSDLTLVGEFHFGFGQQAMTVNLANGNSTNATLVNTRSAVSAGVLHSWAGAPNWRWGILVEGGETQHALSSSSSVLQSALSRPYVGLQLRLQKDWRNWGLIANLKQVEDALDREKQFQGQLGVATRW